MPEEGAMNHPPTSLAHCLVSTQVDKRIANDPDFNPGAIIVHDVGARFIAPCSPATPCSPALPVPPAYKSRLSLEGCQLQ